MWRGGLREREKKSENLTLTQMLEAERNGEKERLRKNRLRERERSVLVHDQECVCLDEGRGFKCVFLNCRITKGNFPSLV